MFQSDNLLEFQVNLLWDCGAIKIMSYHMIKIKFSIIYYHIIANQSGIVSEGVRVPTSNQHIIKSVVPLYSWNCFCSLSFPW